MSFQHSIKIPRERIGALIGKRGKVKLQIEKRCGVEIAIDSETGDAMVSGTEARTSSSETLTSDTTGVGGIMATVSPRFL